MKRIILASALVMSLGACELSSAINKITVTDTQWALKDAQAHGDTGLVPCYQQALSNAQADLAAGTPPPGVFSAAQQARDECGNLNKLLAACQPVASAAPLAYATVIGAASAGCKGILVTPASQAVPASMPAVIPFPPAITPAVKPAS